MSDCGDGISSWEPEFIQRTNVFVCPGPMPHGVNCISVPESFLTARASARCSFAVVLNNLPVGLEDLVCFFVD